MTNFQKYKDRIIKTSKNNPDSLCTGFQISAVRQLLKNDNLNCGQINCQDCQLDFLLWLMDEAEDGDVFEEEVDWTKVEVDTPIYVSEDENRARWLPRHFGHIDEYGGIWAFTGGQTSFTTDECSPWTYAKLAKKEQK